MDIYCDEEFDINMMEEGYRSPRSMYVPEKGVSEDVNVYLPDDVVSVLADCACEYITDQLAFSLLSDQHRDVMIHKLANQAENGSVRRSRHQQSSSCPSMYELDNIVDYFVTWSHIRIGGVASFVTEEPSSFGALSFYCKSCHSLIITQNEVDSPHYHGGYGPAFLANFVYNCHHSEDEAYETQFTTGVYRVCDVNCLRCNSRVGKKYVEARDPGNYFKVGKILLEQTLLTMPKCCDNRKNLLESYPHPGHYFCSRETGVSCFCSVCLGVVQSTTARAILTTTNNLEPTLTTELLSLLIDERHILVGGGTENYGASGTAVVTARSSNRHNTTSGLSSCSPSAGNNSSSSKLGSVLARFVGGIPGISSSASDSPVTSSPTTPRATTPRRSLTLGGGLGSIGGLDSSSSVSSSLSSTNGGGEMVIPRLKPESIEYLSRSIGARLAMFPENQNWMSVLRFISEMIQSTNLNHGILLVRPVVIESLVIHCGDISYQSASLLLSRLSQNGEDRKAAILGLRQKNALTNEQIMTLCNMAATANASSGSTAANLGGVRSPQKWFTPYE